MLKRKIPNVSKIENVKLALKDANINIEIDEQAEKHTNIYVECDGKKIPLKDFELFSQNWISKNKKGK